MTAEESTVSIVIPARDEEYAIGGCLRSLGQQSIGPKRLEVIVVVAGTDQTAAVAGREGAGRFGRFEVILLEAGNKNVALRIGCLSAQGGVTVLVDADTDLEPTALAELLLAIEQNPDSVVHGAALPQINTWISRYWELNRKLTKDLHFDGNLSGEVVAIPRRALSPPDLPELFPANVSAQDDLHLGRMLRRRGWRIAYAAQARATTLVPWTFRGLSTTMLRSRRGSMRILPWLDAGLQAGKSALLVAAVPAMMIALHWSVVAAALCVLPLLLYGAATAWKVELLRRRGLGNYFRILPGFLVLDLLARGLKVWAFAERLAGRNQLVPFRGERPSMLLGER